MYVQVAAYIIGIICLVVGLFQLLLAFGVPLGDFAWGGKYKVLPKSLRIASFVSIFILIFIGSVFLSKAKIIDIGLSSKITNILSWVFTIYFGVNTLGNFFSNSKKEKLVMTPVTIIMTIAGVIITING